MIATSLDHGFAADTPVRAARRLTLRDDRVWIVERGEADLYVSATGDANAGRRHHLCRAQAGDVVFGVSTDDATLHAACEDGQVRGIEWPVFVTSLAKPDAACGSHRAIQRWVALFAAVADRGRPTACEMHRTGERIDAPQRRCIRVAEGVAWARMLAGAAHACGNPALTLEPNGLAPVSAHAWLALEPGAGVELMSIDDVMRRGELGVALAAARALWGAAIRTMLERTAREEIDRQRRAFDETRRDLADALARIACSDGRRVPALPVDGGERELGRDEALVAACRAVAVCLGAPTDAPVVPGESGSRAALERISSRWGLRPRQVVLRDGWWTQDQGPLVAFRRASKQPVALIPRGVARYELVDPQRVVPALVTDAVAQELGPTAFTFYRDFPSAAIDGRALLRMAGNGCGRDLISIALIGMAGGLLASALPVAIAVLVNTIIPSAERGQLLQWLLLVLACSAAAALLQVGRGIAVVRLEARIGCRVLAAVWARLISLPMQFFREYSAGALFVRAMGLDSLRQAIFGATLRGLLGAVFSIFNFALLFYYNAYAALFAAALLGVLVSATLLVTYLQLQEQRAVMQLRAKTSGIVLQFLTGIAKLRVGGAEARAFGVWARLFSEQRGRQWRYRALGNALGVFNAVFPILAHVVLFMVLAQHVEQSPVRTGDVLAFVAAFSGCVSAALSTTGAITAVMAVMPSYELARPILQTLPERSSREHDPGQLAGEISADRLVFQYSSEGPLVLDDVSFRVHPRQFVAFVGPTGSGKSTILRLLLGFETPQSGAVSVDGLDLKGLDIRAVRRQIGVVLQSGRLIPGDVYTNIVGCTSASLDQAWEAARMAGLDEEIRMMPMGMHTVVTDSGGTLSGGQRQRLMIARAIVNRPRILLFDEATSSLDNRTQTLVSRSLEELQASRIVIAHRLSTIVNADRIFVLVRGRIVQSGTYRELIAQPGFFAELAQRQVA